MRIWVNITSESGELLERVAVVVDSSNDFEGVTIEQEARKIADHISMKFECGNDFNSVENIM